MSEVFRHEATHDFSSFRFVQDGNTLGTTEETEVITIRLETQHPGDPPFMVIETKGWSFDTPEQFLKLLNAVHSAYERLNDQGQGKR